MSQFLFFFNDPATTEIYTLSLHDALPIWSREGADPARRADHGARGGAHRPRESRGAAGRRSEEHTSELQSLTNLVCRLLLEKKKKHHWRQTRTKQKCTCTTTITPHRLYTV